MLSASASPRCQSYQRRPNMPVNAMLDIRLIEKTSNFMRPTVKRKQLTINRTALTASR